MTGENAELIRVLEETRRWLALPENDFSWSSWVDQAAALREVDEDMAAVARGEDPTDLGVLFAPTGPIQEVSLSSGWGQEFLVLARQFEAAWEAYRAQLTRRR
ncbi:MAG: hypothetical protein K1X39_15015 [Thermoflexales bacterium]|nr:hypothetical protein [Thermoflexales bacterium]